MASQIVARFANIRFYRPYSFYPYSSLSAIPWFDFIPARSSWEAYDTIRYLYSLLLPLFVYYGLATPSSSPYRYPYGSFSDTDTLCHYQCLVENIHPYSSYWWSNRIFNRFFFPFQLQSYVVVVPCDFALGLGRIEPNYPPTTLSFASVYGVFPRYS